MPNIQRPKGLWEAYGGWRALMLSPYLWGAALISFLFYPLWEGQLWVELSQGIFPDLLGFTLGGFAIFVAFGDKRFLSVMSGSTNDEVSPLVEISASFAHFIFCQVFALLYSILFASAPGVIKNGVFSCINGCDNAPGFLYVFSYFGAFLMIYALLLSVAAVVAIYKLVAIYDVFGFDSNKD